MIVWNVLEIDIIKVLLLNERSDLIIIIWIYYMIYLYNLICKFIFLKFDIILINVENEFF